jgi:PAS domain S-box-containing protein
MMAGELQAFIDGLVDGVVVIDRDHLVQQLNQAMRAYLSLVDDQILGRPCFEVLPCHQQPPGEVSDDCPASQVFTTGRADRRVRFCLMGGAPIWIDVVASPVANERGEVDRVVEIWRDITAQKEMEEWHERRVRELSALHLISVTCSQSLGIHEILNRSLDQALEVLQADAGGVYLLDEQEKVLRLRAYRSVSSDVVEDIDYLRLGEGFSGKVVESGQPLIVDDVRTDPRLTREMLNREDLHALLSVPLKSRTGTIGTLWVASRPPSRRFLESERDWLTAVGGQVGLALENARLSDEVQRREVERSQLLAHLIEAQEQERKRVARGLHDEVSQILAALAVATDGLLGAAPAGDMEMRRRLYGLKAGLVRVIDSIHQVILELRPGVLDDLGLIPALRWYASSRLEPLGIWIDFFFTELNLGLTPEQETSLFRVFQEAINNVAQHSEAHTVRISVASGGQGVTVTVADDGKGFDLSEPMDLKASTRGMGLLGMKERLSPMGGELKIETFSGNGTCLSIQLPRAGEGRGAGT